MTKPKVESVTKAVLAESIGGTSRVFTAKKAVDIVESILDGIRETLIKGEDVKISGFGKFMLHDKKARMGRNPQTGEKMTISERRVLKFKVSECLKAELNGGVIPPASED